MSILSPETLGTLSGWRVGKRDSVCLYGNCVVSAGGSACLDTDGVVAGDGVYFYSDSHL